MTERNLFCGCDPGNSGSVTFINANGNEVIRFAFGATEADIAAVFRNFAPQVRMAYLEKVASMPGQGIVSMFTFGQSFGFLRGLLTAFEIPWELVRPLKWQSAMECMSGGDKNVTKQRAQQLWPGLKWTHALADSALIAEFCRRRHTRTNSAIESDSGSDNPRAGARSDATGHSDGKTSGETKVSIFEEFDKL